MKLPTRFACALIVILALLPPAIYVLFFDAPAYLLSVSYSVQVTALLLLVPTLFVARETATSLRKKSESPLTDLKAAFRAEWKRLLAVCVFVLLIALVSRFFSYNKNLIDSFVPFYLDPFLAQFEYRLFLDHHPWQFTHALLGDQATILIDKMYVSWFFVVPAILGAVIISRDTAFQIKTALSLYFTWIILGSFLAIAFASVGPVYYQEFYGDDLYAPLIAELQRVNAITPLMQQEISQWLLDQRGEGGFGSGISAMPSIHVALAWLFYLVVRDRMANRYAGFAALAFAIITWIGSVHLAWHYVLDGLFSILALSLFWRFLGMIEIGDAGTDNSDRAPGLETNPASATSQT